MAFTLKHVFSYALLLLACRQLVTNYLLPYNNQLQHPVIPLIYPLFIISAVLFFYLKPRQKKINTPPGPFSLPIFGNWLQVGNDLNHRFLAKLALKYGNVFLLKLGARNLVVISDPKLATEVLHTQGVEFGSRPRNVVFDIFTGNGQDMVFTSYGDHWRKMRRIMTLPFFTNKVVQQYKDMWCEEMDLVLKDLRSNKVAMQQGMLIRRRLQLMLYNIMYRMMFDCRFESENDPMFLQATKFNSERSRLAQSFEYNYGDFIPILRPLLRGYLNKCKDLQGRRLAFFNNYFVEKRRKVLSESGSNRNNKKLACAIDHILEAEKNGEISSQNVIYIVENINVAAIETTLWSMEWAIAELVNHPQVQDRVRKEMTEVLQDEEISESNLEKLPYLQAVVKETLRLHSPIPLLVPHMNLEEARLGGCTVPRGSKVVVNAWWLANNPEWWNKPAEFRPERFLEEECGVDATVGGKVDFRFVPFGMGRRSCPGIILALPILGLILGKLVRNFEMITPPGVDKVDVSEKGGQFSLHIAKHSLVAFRPVN
ncbi:cytochrome P450 CYP73A100-like [Dioscorea cayenensis subsp. rotundata]|uniref:Cytochrome P450 CYP73A100-like n=1 Tax=Dioscorea cayennensis subsp. rotundata TaxID=55577 RepID=A0AB40C1K6_DIOCR|nr:cytochrome P450 CYP73A100-like [Dioscorea cayenensis subsp. rotundata]